MSSILKWKGGTYGPGLGLHSDAPGSPEGRLSTGYNAICNGAYCLSDYSEAGGAIAMVPGSHRLGRQPIKGEGVEDAVPVEAPAGSLVFWVANMWHGAYPRTIDGLRMTITNYFCHRAFKTQERYQTAVPDEMLARHGERFARFLGADDFNGWGKEGPGPGAARAASYKERTRPASS
jgi:ectoine hydroxylase-related dioxygenase (phytanoyl-CoA dioxygenase family)